MRFDEAHNNQRLSRRALIFQSSISAVAKAGDQVYPDNFSFAVPPLDQSLESPEPRLLDIAATAPTTLPSGGDQSIGRNTSAKAPARKGSGQSGPLNPFVLMNPNATEVWGIVGASGYFLNQTVAPNGVEYSQLFSLDLDFNLWLYRPAGVYLYDDVSFRAQSPSPGQTNSHQGIFDFSKREFDMNAGAAWNYYQSWEFRVFAYSSNNLNRGNSRIHSSGYNDGVGIENRYYFSPTYQLLGTSAYDLGRSDFVSFGYYPTKTMVDASGTSFKPGPFFHLYVTRDLFGPRAYLYGDVVVIGTRGWSFRTLDADAGIAIRPIRLIPRFELRLGARGMFDLHGSDQDVGGYASIRYLFD